jgi:antitoxin HicB
MKYLAIIEKTATGYSGFVPDLDTAVLAAFPTLEKVQTALSEGLSLYAQEENLPKPKYKKLEDVPELEDFTDLETIWVEPAPINPVSLEIAKTLKTQNLRPADLAKRLGVSRANVVRIVDPFYFGHSLALLNRVAEALGRKLTVKLEVSR